ncbi:hypothetical protein KSP39_PZI004409 [Platanthera zijinensis]|uniref:MINDY deubiquitinase domain-containing protein n=1 Tax=Platanthera zijinensis TaxID=2320716 RepID=A0AAP0BXY0_9ASPA
MAAEDRRSEVDDVAYKTKVVQFLGRSTPIVLQNENGPCPLLAICNVLLLRNSINLSLDAPEVPLHKLLSLVAEKLIDSNSSVQEHEKDDGYLINQQQNIADAIDLLSRLATGIDVNVQFRKVNDFEFTRECAIFDLLDIGLYHGWIVDPQDSETSAAIGSKSYNALAGELVAFEAGKSVTKNEKVRHTDSVDFVAATTAALGMPSPSISKSISFDYPHESLLVGERKGKGDIEEEAMVMLALNLSKAGPPSTVNDTIAVDPCSPAGTTAFGVSALEISTCSSMPHNMFDSKNFDHSNKIVPQESDAFSDCKDAEVTSVDDRNNMDRGFSVDSTHSSISGVLTNNTNQDLIILSAESDASDGSSAYKMGACPSGDHLSYLPTSSEVSLTSKLQKKTDEDVTNFVAADLSDSAVQHQDFQSQLERNKHLDVSEIVSSLSINEPLYEGEEHILDSSVPAYEDREAVYEGEMLLAEQASNAGEASSSIPSNDQVTERQCQLIKNFLEGTANQLTIYGLFCLQEGLKERELCIFFRNNHFSTMFKFNGELYLLVTDQGYMNQPDLVWEKLNEVNGDTVFMTGNFTQFKADDQVNESWNEQTAITSTADYLSTLEGSVSSNLSFNSDLQLAIALQQQEFEHQPPQRQSQEPPQQQPQTTQTTSDSGRSRLVTGPQVSRNTTNMPQKSESKLKEKCEIM